MEKRQELWLPSSDDNIEKNRAETQIDADVTSSTNSTSITTIKRRGKSRIERYGKESADIAAGAARLKRAEIMAYVNRRNPNPSNSDAETLRSFLVSLSEDWRGLVIRSAACLYRLKGIADVPESSGKVVLSTATMRTDRDALRVYAPLAQRLGNRRNPNPSNSDAETLRSFLVSLSEDWRGLVIRSAACLYRLKGIADVPESSGKVVLSTATMRTARDALRVYAPLAQRLGMQRLKSELENNAFKILYHRQYSVASSLLGDDVDEMKAIVQVLTSRIEQLLRSDQIFIDQIDDVTVSSRVKEPYSLWRKMLRIRKEAADAKRDGTSTTNDSVGSDNVSIRWIPDAIALRVVLRGAKLSPWEDGDSLRTREKMLCYYALQLISDVWPASTANKAKVNFVGVAAICYFMHFG